MDRWATFDCYGTLIDWNGGIRAELRRLFGDSIAERLAAQLDADAEVEAEADGGEVETDGNGGEAAGASEESGSGREAAAPALAGRAGDEGGPAGGDAGSRPPETDGVEAELDALLLRYHALERQLERDGTLSYREVMSEAMRQLGAPEGEEGGLAASLPAWEPFPEVPEALAEVRARGWKLALLSNSDLDLIEASKARLGVPFEETVVASEIRSYKPAVLHWMEFYGRTLANRRRHVHVAASSFHDIVPAARLRIPNVWINRLGEHPQTAPTRQLPDLVELPGVLDELIPD